MKSPDTTTRRHRSHRSKPKHRPTARISSAYAPKHVAARPGGWSHGNSKTVTDGNKENLVRGWLDDIQVHGSEASERRPKPKNDDSDHTTRRSSPSPVRWAPHGLSVPQGLGNAQPLSRPRRGDRHKRRRASLDDSSVILARPHDKAPILADDDEPARRSRSSSAAEESYYERGKWKHQPDAEPNESGASLTLFAPNHTFEKRGRHKTRSDRYDVVKHRNDNKEGTKKKGRTGAAAEPKKPKKRKRENMTSAKEVMDNFTSHSILSERITVSCLIPGNG